MIKVITVYSTTTGKILRVVTAPEYLLGAQIRTGESYIDCKGCLDTEYVSSGELIARPVMSINIGVDRIFANSVDEVSLTSLPDPCTITYSGPGFYITKEVVGGAAEFTTDVVGLHTIKVEAFPYLDWEGTFNAI